MSEGPEDQRKPAPSSGPLVLWVKRFFLPDARSIGGTGDQLRTSRWLTTSATPGTDATVRPAPSRAGQDGTLPRSTTVPGNVSKRTASAAAPSASARRAATSSAAGAGRRVR